MACKNTVQEWRLTIENTETIISHIASRSQLTRGTAELGVVANCVESVNIEGLHEDSFTVMTLPTMANRGVEMWNVIKTPTTTCFPNLSTIVIAACNGLKDLTWLLFAQNLTNVSSSKKLEDIISKEKATSNVTEDEECLVTPFQKLEYLVLNDLPALKSIYWSPLSFPRLKEIFIKNNCLELRKLPLDSRSGVTNEELVIKYKEKEWMERVVWEDEATQHRFLPSCKFVKGP
ncbi:putative disease resistance protein [Raphanus sativus]|nr:putative disease resistance protein [Raphanus sativus]